MAKRFSRFQRIREEAQALLDERGARAGQTASKWRRFVHFWVLVGTSFTRNRLPVRASALAYATLLALIPMLAVVVSITSTFLKKEGEDRIDRFIIDAVSSATTSSEIKTDGPKAKPAAKPEGQKSAEGEPPGATAVEPAPTNSAAAPVAHDGSAALPGFAKAEDAVKMRKDLAHWIHEFIRNTRSGALGMTGSVVLIFVAISMLTRIETTFNDIWGVARGRNWFMRIVLYWGVLSLAPLLLVLVLGLATGPHFEATRRMIDRLPVVGTMLFSLGFQLLPVVVLCLAFGAFYMLMPNARVDWRAALVGGLVGGILFHLNNVVSVLYVSRVVSNSKIYGSLGLVPVFMVGLYFSWLILLFGAQVAYAFQNRGSYIEERQVETVNQRGREFVALRLMTLVGRRFVQGETSPSVPEMCEELGVPTRLIQQIMQTLVAARLVVETTGTECGYVPARPLETITCHDILLAMRATQGQELATRDEPARVEVYGEFQRIQEAERHAASSVTMLALANRAARKELA
jgi:membrane protein